MPIGNNFPTHLLSMQLHGISVAIPNYNGAKLLPEILPALYIALEQSAQPFEIIISDDCSTDNSVEIIRQNFPTIQVLQNEVNLGFSHTINKAIFAARYDYVLMLNSDVKLCPHYFEPLFKYFDEPDTFGVMGRIIGWDDDHLQDAAKYPAFHGVKIKTSGNYVAIQPAAQDRLYSIYLSGANAFVSREKLLALQGFDEIFAPFYIEDYELCLRAWRLGWKCYYEHFAVCRHQISVTIKSKKSKNFINAVYYRNKMFMHVIHLNGIKLLLWYLQLIPEMLIRLFTLRFYYFAALGSFVSRISEPLASKKRLRMLARNKGVKLKSLQEVVVHIKEHLSNQNVFRIK